MKAIILSIFIFVSTSLTAEDSVSNAELGRKLDLILSKVNELEERVANLENANSEVKKEIEGIQQFTKDAKTATKAISLPQNSAENKSFMDKLRIQLKIDEVKASGAWTKPETWSGVRRNLTEFKIRKLLGNPTKIKNSLNPRIDRVYHYEGDLDADGTTEKGEVRFYRDRVVSFTSPFE